MLTNWCLPPLLSYRVGHCLFLAVTAAILFWSCASWEMAVVSVGSLLFMPQVFSHGHLNATDVPTACCWVLTITAWLRGETSWAWRLVAGIACGLGLATKATFVLVPLMLAAWIVLFRRWAWWRALLVLCVVASIVALACCPMWWGAPLSRCAAYYQAVFGNEQIWKIEVYYLGRSYVSGLQPIPWHSALILPLVTTPPWTIALVVAALLSWFRTRDAAMGLWLLGAAALPVLRLLPRTPAHDGVRLLLPSLFCLAPLAGYGFVALTNQFRLISAIRRPLLCRWCIAIGLVVVGAGELASMHPYEMSYYSELIGGLGGAERLGFEVSYWFEAFSPRALHEIERLLPQGARVWTFPQYPGYTLLRQWGLWREDLEDGDIGAADYLILYTRKSRFYAVPGVEGVYLNQRPLWSLRCRGVQLVGLYKL